MSAYLDVTGLRNQITGPVLLPGDPGYDNERATFNLNTPLTPAVAVGAATVEDVRAAIRFAARNALAVAIRGGGHLQPRTGEEHLLLTLDRMNSVVVDPERATVRIVGTPRWQQIMDVATPSGLAPMNGSSPSVGAIGYLLGGGVSPVLGRLHGYASDHVTSIDVVTADGESRTATATDEPQLFFALRGSKGNVGVVTAMEFALWPIRTVHAGGLWFAGERLAEVLPAWRDWAVTLPDEATTSVAIKRMPDLPHLPDPLRGAFVVHVRYSFVGPEAAGEAMLKPMRGLGTTVFGTVGTIPYAESGTIHRDTRLPQPYFDRSLGLRELSDGTLSALVDLVGPGSDCPLVSVEVRMLGGALDRTPVIPDAVSTRGLPLQFVAVGVGGPEEAPRMRAYLARCVDGLTPWAHPRRMVNFLSSDEALAPQEMRQTYGPELYDRIVAVKEKYDPDNMFRVNHNIVRL